MNVRFRRVNQIFLAIMLCLMISSCKNEKKSDNSNAIATNEQFSDSLPWSQRLANSIMKRHPKAWKTENDSLPKWNYKIGLLLTSFERLFEQTGEDKYFDYIQDFGETLIDSSGIIHGYTKDSYNIDNINAGKILFKLYKTTNDQRYLQAMKTLRSQLEDHPRTSSNGLWHKKIYPNQMWLDGLYMGAPFYAQYNTTFEDGDRLDDIAHQFELIWKQTLDEETGLLFHAWDESKQMDWANKKDGKSPNFWSRSMGWYLMALVDVLDFYPENHPKRSVLINYLNQLSQSLLAFQHPTGLWYQVTDKGEMEGNYLEASGSEMFCYAFAKGNEKGYLPVKFKSIAHKTFDGLLSEVVEVEADGEVHINNICKSAGLGGNPYRDGSFEYYISEPIVTDNLHGTGPFILAALALNR
ncbi:glycoside hydrolase family 88 protein [Maribacter confluentis]|uniref:Glycoside hydrolase family 88 protein n=1 Tax=Maribacter confluentis TaxID=1656093 RepID=A0ABT8RSF7_9FLAO|nr:glycoside hydrolase family 88 protein [Maribacter confluentis]MDO1513831.1 glycoside hydrolase family 88 protein [Maribacter confluentis]